MSLDFNDYKQAWQVAQSGWGLYLQEAKKDTRCFCGDQWSPEMRQYLKDQSRSDAVYNKVKRVVNFISGYERRNRLSLNAKPRGMSDDGLANQQSAVLLNVMSNFRGNDICSEAFKMGTCVSGINLIETYIDSNGNIAFNRDAYNQILLDPMFTKSDLSDCAFILRERAVTKDQAKLFFPDRASDIDLLHTGTTSNLFSEATHNSKMFNEHTITYGEYHRQTLRNAIMLTDRQSGVETEFNGSQEELNYIAHELQMQFAITNKAVKSMRLQVYLQEELFYDGPCPYGMDEYRFTPVMGDYVPELDNDMYKLQGIVRSIRAPQIEFNRRMSQEVDLLESQIASGWIAEEGQVVDPNSLYQTGQGKVIYVKSRDDDNVSGVAAIQRIPAPTISAGMDQLSNKQAALIDTVAGTNEELFGSDNKDIAGVLSRMRTGAALTIMHPYFDSYRSAKRRLGTLIIKMVQNNYAPQKVEQLTEEAIHPDFYKADILENDISVQEGLHTDSQRETAYMELKSLKKEGMTGIPDSYIMELMPVHMKDGLQKHLQQIEQQQQQANQQEIQLTQQQMQVNNELIQSETAKNIAKANELESKMVANIARADESGSQVVENLSTATLNKAKAENLNTQTSDTSEFVYTKPRKPRRRKAVI